MIGRNGLLVWIVAIQVLLFAGIMLLLVGTAAVQGQGLLVPTDSYQLDTGQTITWWLDEPHGLFCYGTGRASDNVKCESLKDTSFYWQIGGK